MAKKSNGNGENSRGMRIIDKIADRDRVVDFLLL